MPAPMSENEATSSKRPRARCGRARWWSRRAMAVVPNFLESWRLSIQRIAQTQAAPVLLLQQRSRQRAYVLADLSGRCSSDGWTRVAIGAFRQYGADRIVAEGNEGGDLVRTLSRRSARTCRSRSCTRAEASKPVAALHEEWK